MTGPSVRLDAMTTPTHTTVSARSHDWISGLRSSLSERQQARAARRTLQAELATYRTPSEVEDLFAALRTQDDNPTAEEMRHLLFLNLDRHRHTRTAA